MWFSRILIIGMKIGINQTRTTFNLITNKCYARTPFEKELISNSE